MLDNGNYSYQNMSDENLFDLVKKDDRKAFEEIYGRYWNFLTSSAAINLQSRQIAEDIVQEIFISFYNRRYSIEFTVSLRAYLCKSLNFKIMNEVRSQIVRNTYHKTVLYTYCVYSNNNAYHLCESKELAFNLKHTIALLPGKCRQAFLLSREENLSYKEIAVQMSISVSTVEKHVSRALKILKGSLNNDGFSCN